MGTTDWFFLWLLAESIIGGAVILLLVLRQVRLESHIARHDREIGDILRYAHEVEKDRREMAYAYRRLVEQRCKRRSDMPQHADHVDG